MSVIPGEGRVPILYGNHAMASPPHRTGYLARPDAVDRHPAVVITAGTESSAALRTLARHLARYGYAAIVPPGSRTELAGAVDAFGEAWGDWSRADRRAVIGVGAGADWATEVAAERGLPLVLLTPSGKVTPPETTPVLGFGIGGEAAPETRRGHWVVYRGLGAGFWDDASPDYSAAAAIDCWTRVIAFLDRHLGWAAAA